MAGVDMTASIASGNMTNPATFSLGPYKAFVAHYSAVATASLQFRVNFNRVVLAYASFDNNNGWSTATDTAYGVYAQLSNAIGPGYVFIMGD